MPDTSAGRCVELAQLGLSELDAMTTHSQGDEVEKLVLAGSLWGLVAKQSVGLQRAGAGWRSLNALSRAERLEANNPRAVFSNACAGHAIGRTGSRESEEAFARIVQCERMFDRPAAPGAVPVWGHLHVLLYLCEAHLRRREVVLAQQAVAKLQRMTRGQDFAAVNDVSDRIAHA